MISTLENTSVTNVAPKGTVRRIQISRMEALSPGILELNEFYQTSQEVRTVNMEEITILQVTPCI